MRATCASRCHISKISEENSSPQHPKVLARDQSVANTNGSWAGYTAIPSDAPKRNAYDLSAIDASFLPRYL